MVNEEVTQRIRENYAKGEEIIRYIEKELPLLQKAVAQKQQEKLATDIKEKNLQLKKELEFWLKRVTDLEIMNGIKQYSPTTQASVLPTTEKQSIVNASSSTNQSKTSAPKIDAAKLESSTKGAKKAPSDAEKKPTAKEGKKEKPAKPPKQEKSPAEENKEVDVSRLDLRIGRILNAKRHPDAESLYVEEIDVGEEKPRTVVSGLVKFVPLEEMQNRLVVVLCNLKPAKMRGITSEAMVMCASTPEKVEILSPPANSVPGDRVVCDEFPGEPDSLLNPKKKIFEQVAPDLKTDGSCNATYKSATLKVASKGVVKSLSLTNVQIK